MANKQTSFFATFIVTFLGVTTLGLCILYFGVFQKKIVQCQEYIVQMQSKPTPEISLNFTVDDSGVSRGTAEVKTTRKKPAKKNNEAIRNKGDKPKRNSLEPKEKPIEKTKSTCGNSGVKRAKPIDRKSRRPSRSRKTQFNQVNDDDDDDDEMSPTHHGPAFPSNKLNNDQEDNAEIDDDRARDVPDINDPEMDDNPLIRALREASSRSQENPRDPNEKPVNPFEAILNNQDK